MVIYWYWLDTTVSTDNEPSLILGFAAMYKTVNTFPEAVGVLADMKIIGSPDYWLQNVLKGAVQAEYATRLMQNIGKHWAK